MRYQTVVLVISLAAAGCNRPAENSSTSVAPTPVGMATTTAATIPVGGAPSQSRADAERDGVVSALAELPVSLRVDPVTTMQADGGLWVLSRPQGETAELAPGCGLGDPDGLYGRDIICVSEYGEVLLMDPSGERILRAYPLPGLPPSLLLVTEDAVFCGRWGDGALPDSMLCRVDRNTLEWSVRVFPGHQDSAFSDVTDRHIPANWTIDDPIEDSYIEEMELTDAGLTVNGSGGSRLVDPITLELQPPTD